MKRPVMLLVGILALASCSSSDPSPGNGSGSTPLVSPRAAAAGGTALTVGPVVVMVPASMTPVAGLTAQPGQQVGGYRSAPNDQGRSGALLVTVATTAQRSPAAEAEALVGQKRDVQKATNVRMSPVTWPGFKSAAGVEYDDAPASAGAPSPLHGLVVLALTDAGQLVSVTALAPRALFDSLDLTSAVASLRLSNDSG